MVSFSLFSVLSCCGLATGKRLRRLALVPLLYRFRPVRSTHRILPPNQESPRQDRTPRIINSAEVFTHACQGASCFLGICCDYSVWRSSPGIRPQIRICFPAWRPSPGIRLQFGPRSQKMPDPQTKRTEKHPVRSVFRYHLFSFLCIFQIQRCFLVGGSR